MTVVAQIQNLRNFITTNLGDVIDLTRHLEADPLKDTTGDIAYVQIKTPFNTYKMAMGSAYAEPPAGAPSVCRSLGWMTFQHVGEDKYVLAPKNDLTYQDISKHIHERELTDALATHRRELAEAKSPEEAQQIRIRMKEVAVKAERWGIKANVPEEPVAPRLSELAALPQHHNVPVKTVENLTGAESGVYGGHAYTGVAPFVGAPIIYYCADRIAGMDQVPGILIRIQRDGRAALQLFADLNEIQFKDNIIRRGSDAGNGRVHTSNCWDFNPEWLREQERIRHLEEAIEKTADEFNELLARLAALEAKPKRGRPPKPEGGETEGAELASELEPT